MVPAWANPACMAKRGMMQFPEKSVRHNWFIKTIIRILNIEKKWGNVSGAIECSESVASYCFSKFQYIQHETNEQNIKGTKNKYNENVFVKK